MTYINTHNDISEKIGYIIILYVRHQVQFSVKKGKMIYSHRSRDRLTSGKDFIRFLFFFMLCWSVGNADDQKTDCLQENC